MHLPGISQQAALTIINVTYCLKKTMFREGINENEGNFLQWP
jgi:hypothetical protein